MSKTEWLADFKRINGRDPKPLEFRKALNNGEFSLENDDQFADTSAVSIDADPDEHFSRKERRLLKKNSRQVNTKNGINSVLLSIISFVFTLSPLLVVLNPKVLLKYQDKASIENLGSLLIVMFFFGVLLLLLAFVFALVSFFESPRRLGIAGFFFALVNLIYVYTIINYVQFANGDLNSAVNILQNILK